MVAQAEEALGGVDILVNNAGAQFVAPVDEFPDEKWDQILVIDLRPASTPSGPSLVEGQIKDHSRQMWFWTPIVVACGFEPLRASGLGTIGLAPSQKDAT